MSAFTLFALATAVACVVVLAVPARWAAGVSAVGGVVQSLLLVVAGLRSVVGPAWSLYLWRLNGWGDLGLHGTVLGGYLAALAGVVLVAVFLYTPRYMDHYRQRYELRPFLAVVHLLVGSIALILVAGDVVTFLIAWEIMSILSYLTVTFDHLNRESARAGYLMLGASEVGFLLVIAAWLPLVLVAHRVAFTAIAAAAPHHLPAALQWAVFLLSFAGFGVKAGLFPGMSWLPRAHPAAPANASAILSGIILNLGIYGILLTNAVLLPVPRLSEGLVVLVVGSLSAIIGILYAATDTHLKRLLAHSSIENMGLVTAALGVALTFDAVHLRTIALLAWIACLYHLTNHSLYKTLLFLGAGTVDQAAGTLEMDRMGGLGRVMPWTGVFMLAGTMAIAALPPFNGFTSEWLILQSLLRSVDLHRPGVEAVFALCAALLALTAGLAATAFIRFYGMTFLGRRRGTAAPRALEAAASQRGAMAMLAALCLVLGVAPTYMAAALARVIASFASAGGFAAFVPTFFSARTLPPALAKTFLPLGAGVLGRVLPAPGVVFLHQSAPSGGNVVFAMAPSYLALTLALGVALVFTVVRVAARGRRVVRGPVWAGGLRRLEDDMVYTATAMSRPIWVVFRGVLGAGARSAQAEEVVAEHFRMAISRDDTSPYLLDRLLVAPAARGAAALARLLARMHHGDANTYVIYALVALIAALILVRV